ncbi:hypothetical protein [Aquimarina sp. RZ0]|uniref:hypothetical protein n=1 Tax=Aquimarina sp. RZ0 TaxID=2607730 RepID=UPI0011F111CF|nr:hypothetical protein [Aquimarina sp. RZ0]KAA1245537.1 hypothetical protein F0000_11325 [Aquimarina sp. RZ0]
MDILEKERIVKRNIIEIFKENFSNPITEKKILTTIPEEKFKEYRPYYESIMDIFLLESEQEKNIMGSVHTTIKKVAILWNISQHSFYPWEEQVI